MDEGQVPSPRKDLSLSRVTAHEVLERGEGGLEFNCRGVGQHFRIDGTVPRASDHRSQSSHRYHRRVRYVAFLRGINVGGRNIQMGELRACFDDMGFSEVSTVLQTENVIFNSAEGIAKLKRRIETGLSAKFDYPARVQVLTLTRLEQIIEASPFGENVPETHSYIVFFEDGLEHQLMLEAKELDDLIERIQVGDGVIYWQVPRGSTLQSDFAKLLTKARYKNFHTNRNINTLRKVVR